MKSKLGMIAAAALGALLATGCGSKESVQGVYEEERAERQVESGEMLAGDVYTAAVALNQREIDAVRATQGRLDDPALAAFAQKVERDHTEGLRKLEAAAQEIEGLTAYEGKVTRDVKEESYRDAEMLDDVRGDRLDGEFLKVMIDGHQDALNIIDTKLLPSAQGELLQVISELRQQVAMHLEEARQLEAAASK